MYSYDKMIEYLMTKDGMTFNDAMDFIDFNTIGSLPDESSTKPIVLYNIYDACQ